MAKSEAGRGAGGPAGKTTPASARWQAGAGERDDDAEPLDREGPLEIERLRKQDGRALILYSRWRQRD
jgi:hypothetical protein